MCKPLFSFVLLFLFFSVCTAQDDWILRSDKDQIKTWSRKTSDSKINSVKLEAVFTGSLSKLVSVILDVDTYDSWIYKSRNTKLLKKVSPTELYYYSEVIFPWPAANRDFVSHIIMEQDAKTKTVTVRASNLSGMEPPHPGLVRIDHSIGQWILTPLSGNEIKVAYSLQVDPGGGLPAWIINTFSSKGMAETFKNLRGYLAKNASTIHSLPFLAE